MNDEVKKVIEKLKETKELLKEFSTRDEAIEFLVKETGIAKEECSFAYDILIKLDLDKKV